MTKKMANKKLRYIGSLDLTKANYGFPVVYGHTDNVGHVHVWSPAFWWVCWGTPYEEDWEDTGEPSEYPGKEF